MYEQINSVEDMPDVVYSWDEGFWYDLDVSKKDFVEKLKLLEENILYKKIDEEKL